jgi:hypothetical protein
MEIDQNILKIVAATIITCGDKVDHGGGHVVKEYVTPDGVKFEMEMCDYGYGRKIWKGDILIGTYL